jgi:circadian clock protein KaiC
VLEAKISSLQTEFESVEEELNKIYLQEELKKEIIEKTRQEMTRIRKREGDGVSGSKKE